jgi:hypothetical protein
MDISLTTARIALLLLVISCFSCTENKKEFVIDSEYLLNFEKLYEGGLANNRPFYLQLVGLYKLDPMTPNRFGASEEIEYPLEIDGIPNIIGSIELVEDAVIFNWGESVEVKTEEDSVVHNGPISLDEYGNTIDLYHGRLSWRVATYGKDKYLRMRDLENPEVKEFKGYQQFELTPEFIFEATFKPYEQPKIVKVASSMGFDRDATFIGTISFEYQEQEYKLSVQPGRFIMFSDDTSADQTYGSGRYLKFGEPGEDGKVILDFNYAYNPPCIFSKYTTCLFPPESNRLPFKVLAGEITQPF